MLYDQVLTNGEVFFYDVKARRFRREILNIGLSNDQICELSSDTLEGAQTIDLKALTVFPGCIDSQVHFREPGLTHKEDIESGSRAAACGGITSFFEMPNTQPPTTTRHEFNRKMQIAAEKSWVNYAFYIGAQKEDLADLIELQNEKSSPGIKIFMGSSTGSLLVDDPQILESIVQSAQRLLIIHAEDEALLKKQKALAQKSHSVLDHPVWRSPEAALKATAEITELALKHKKRVHILHVSSQEEAEFLALQKKRHPGLISFEILPQYLVMHAPDCYHRLGTKAQMNPPVRERRHQEALWRAVLTGVTDVMGSDHAPHTLEEKSKLYPDSPSGMPGVQTMLPVMLNEASKSKISYERVCELFTEAPRQVFGCHTKGRIARGADADLTIVDLKKTFRVEPSWLQSKCGWSPFENETLTGYPTHTMVMGRWALRDGQLQKPCGKPISFVHHQPST